MIEKEDLQKVADTLTKMSEEPLEDTGHFVICNLWSFHAIQEHNYFVIGTRIIKNLMFINLKWKRFKKALENSFFDADLEHAETYKTYNEAKRAVARNRHEQEKKHITNPDTAMWHGVKLVLHPKNKMTKL